MKILLSVVVVLFSLNSSIANSMSVEEKEALANIYGLYIEKIETDLDEGGLESLSPDEIGLARINIERAKASIIKTDVRAARMFLNLDFELMCSVISKEILAKENVVSQLTQTRVGKSAQNRLSRSNQKGTPLKHKIELAHMVDVKNKICIN